MFERQYELLPPPTDVISTIAFAPNSSKLLVSSWDRQVYLYNAQEGTDTQLLKTFPHRSPVLAVCFGDHEGSAYTAGLDYDVRRLDLSTGEQKVLSSHSAGVKCLGYSPQHDMLVSASWDKTAHIHHPNTPEGTPRTLLLPAKPFALAFTSTTLIVAMSERTVYLYDLAQLSAAAKAPGESDILQLEPFQRRESSLKFMTRALATMADGAGYASSSIEGRVAVEWIDPSEESQARKYAFKCHRGKAPGDEAKDIVYPVHALSFHPSNGTFVTGGGDANVSLWDVRAKRRLKQYKDFPASIAAMDFAGDGSLLAVATSPGFEDGNENVESGKVRLFVRIVPSDEGKEEKKKSKKSKENPET